MKKKADTYSAQRECRLLKQQGLSDEQLLDRGFDRATIQRSVLSTGGRKGAIQPWNRCRVCNHKVYFLPKNATCGACKLRQQLKEETGVTY